MVVPTSVVSGAAVDAGTRTGHCKVAAGGLCPCSCLALGAMGRDAPGSRGALQDLGGLLVQGCGWDMALLLLPTLAAGAVTFGGGAERGEVELGDPTLGSFRTNGYTDAVYAQDAVWGASLTAMSRAVSAWAAQIDLTSSAVMASAAEALGSPNPRNPRNCDSIGRVKLESGRNGVSQNLGARKRVLYIHVQEHKHGLRNF